MSAEEDKHRADVALGMIRATNGVGSPLPWAVALDAWPWGGGFQGSNALRNAIEDLTRDGIVAATPKGLVATALSAAQPAEPGEVPWFRHPDGPEANGNDT